MGRKVFGVRLSQETLDNLSEEAKKKGMNVSDLARQKILVATEYEPLIQKFINYYAGKIKVSDHEIIEKILMDFIARMESFEEIIGVKPKGLYQFVQTNTGLLRGKELFDHLKKYHRDKFIADKKTKLMKAETRGDEISVEDQAFMIEHQLGRTWYDSDEYKKITQKSIGDNQLLHEAKHKKLVPKNMRDPEGIIAGYYRQLKAKEITKAQFKELLENI